MMRSRYWILAAALVAAGCATHRHAAAVRPAPTAFERQIRNAIDAGDGDHRTLALRQRVAAEPDNVAARLELASAYRERGYPDLALEHCRLAAARFPESGAAQLAMARSLRDAGMRKDAVEGLENFLQAHPQKSPDYLAWIGIIRDEMGSLPAGEAAHRAALELTPDSDYLRNNLGYNLLMQGKNEEAAEQFRQALRINPQSRVARNNLGLSLAGGETRQQAILSLQTGTDPATAHSNMAAYLIEKGSFAEARKELEIALSYNDRHPAALKNLELVSRKDAKPATMAMPQTPSGPWWDRWKSSFRKLFVGPLYETPAGVGKPAVARFAGQPLAGGQPAAGLWAVPEAEHTTPRASTEEK